MKRGIQFVKRAMVLIIAAILFTSPAIGEANPFEPKTVYSEYFSIDLPRNNITAENKKMIEILYSESGWDKSWPEAVFMDYNTETSVNMIVSISKNYIDYSGESMSESDMNTVGEMAMESYRNRKDSVMKDDSYYKLINHKDGTFIYIDWMFNSEKFNNVDMESLMYMCQMNENSRCKYLTIVFIKDDKSCFTAEQKLYARLLVKSMIFTYPILTATN